MSDLGRSVRLVGNDSPAEFSRSLPHRSSSGSAAYGRITRVNRHTYAERMDTMPSPADREKALETALAQIDRQFGKGTVMRLGSDERAPVAIIPTGSIALDVALGIGGLPRGRIVE